MPENFLKNILFFAKNIFNIIHFITSKEQLAEKKAMEEAEKKRKQGGLLGFMSKSQQSEEEGSIEFSMAGLFKIMFCVHNKPNDSQIILQALDDLKSKMKDIEG